MFSGSGIKNADGTEWYFPQRLTDDTAAVADGNANPAQNVLDVRSTMGHDLPHSLLIYAFAAHLGGPGVLTAAQILAQQSGIPTSHLTLVNEQTPTPTTTRPAPIRTTSSSASGPVPEKGGWLTSHSREVPPPSRETAPRSSRGGQDGKRGRDAGTSSRRNHAPVLQTDPPWLWDRCEELCKKTPICA